VVVAPDMLKVVISHNLRVGDFHRVRAFESGDSGASTVRFHACELPRPQSPTKCVSDEDRVNASDKLFKQLVDFFERTSCNQESALVAVEVVNHLPLSSGTKKTTKRNAQMEMAVKM